MTSTDRWRLEYDGRLMEVEPFRSGLTRGARLFADGTQVDERTTKGIRARLTSDGLAVVVSWGWFGQPTKIALTLDDETGGEAGESGETTEDKDKTEGQRERREQHPFEPPPGSRAAKRERFAREHPELYASRHVAKATGEVLIGLLGIGAFVKLLLPKIPLPDVDLPDVGMPSIPWPDIPWPSIPWPDVSLPGWLGVVLKSLKYVIPILIALGVAAREVERRKKKEQERAEASRTASGEGERDDPQQAHTAGGEATPKTARHRETD